MSNSALSGLNENNFFERVTARVVEQAPDLSKSLNIAIVGKVSSGKSSLINALLQRSRTQAVAEVGAIAGVTKKLKFIQLDEKVYFIDSPGLDDVRSDNSDITKNFLKHIDVGIFVVTGSSDASQKKNLDDLKEHCDCVFVVLNKIDEWDDLYPEAFYEVVNQWKNDLKVEKIYPTCTKGYNPSSRNPNMDHRGVDRLRSVLQEFLEKKGKDLLLARHMADKKSYAEKIIASALVTVTVAAFLPGSAVSITATQGSVIATLYYLYTGKVLSPQAALAILPKFVAETVGSSLFLFVKSFLPPTGLLDVTAAGIAVSITLAILATVNNILSSGAELEQEGLLRSKFRIYHKQAQEVVRGLALTDISDLPRCSAMVTKFLGNH